MSVSAVPLARAVSFLVAVVCALAATATAAANASGFTRGDAEALFHAGGNGGWAVRLHASVPEGPFAQDGKRILPLGPPTQHACATDWHLINVNAVDGGDQSFRRQDAVESLSPLVFHFAIDGAPVETLLTPIRPWLNPGLFGWDVAYAMGAGVILPPDALAIGSHVVHMTVENWFGPGLSLDPGDVVFYVDPAGSPACTG